MFLAADAGAKVGIKGNVGNKQSNILDQILDD